MKRRIILSCWRLAMMLRRQGRGPIFLIVAAIMLWVVAAAAAEKDYQALSLDDCQVIARQQNPVLGASRERVQELVADYQAARSKFFPRLVLLSYYDRQPPNRFPPSGNPGPVDLFKREGYSAVTGKQLIFDGLKTYYNTQAAKTGTQAQKQEVQRTADELAFTVTQSFYQLVEAKENLQVAQEALNQRQEFARLTNAFFQAGKITRLDSFRAQSQVSEAEQAVVEAQNAVRLAREILAILARSGCSRPKPQTTSAIPNKARVTRAKVCRSRGIVLATAGFWES